MSAQCSPIELLYQTSWQTTLSSLAVLGTLEAGAAIRHSTSGDLAALLRTKLSLKFALSALRT